MMESKKHWYGWFVENVKRESAGSNCGRAGRGLSVILPIYETAGRFSPAYDSSLVYEQIEASR